MHEYHVSRAIVDCTMICHTDYKARLANLGMLRIPVSSGLIETYTGLHSAILLISAPEIGLTETSL